LLAAAGTLLFGAASAYCWSGAPLTLLALIWLAAILCLSPAASAIGYLPHAVILLIFIAAHWASVDDLDPLFRAWDTPSRDPSAPLINLAALDAILITAAIFLAARIWQPPARQSGASA